MIQLPATPGLVYAALISPTGDLLAKLGQTSVDSAIVAVLAQGAMAAMTDLGKRSQLGECGEMISSYPHGGICVVTELGGNHVVLQYTAEASLDQIRQFGRSMLAPVAATAAAPEAPRTITRQSLMDALNVGAP
jgi:hypothetical protein